MGPGDLATGYGYPIGFTSTYYFNFSQAVTGFDKSDIELSTVSPSTSGGTVESVTQISATQYSAEIKIWGFDQFGKLDIEVKKGSYSDSAGNAGEAASKSQDFRIGPPEVIDLGTYGQLINPFGSNYTGEFTYYWDANKNGLYDDRVTHDYIDNLVGGNTMGGAYSASLGGQTVWHTGSSALLAEKWLENKNVTQGLDLYVWLSDSHIAYGNRIPYQWAYPIDNSGAAPNSAGETHEVVGTHTNYWNAIYSDNQLAHMLWTVYLA